jgi:hypothetical protein
MTANDLEGSGHGLMEVTPRNIPGETEENDDGAWCFRLQGKRLFQMEAASPEVSIG